MTELTNSKINYKMPRSFDIAPYLENKNTSLKVVTDKEKVPTDNEYFISDFESDVKNYGAVIFETLESRKIFGTMLWHSMYQLIRF